MSDPTLVLRLPEETVEQIAGRVAEILGDAPGKAQEGWLDVSAAAAHLACSRSRMYGLVHRRAVPHHRDGSRLLFRRDELDDWVREGGARLR